MLRVTAHIPAVEARETPFASLALAHDERRLRRKLLTLPEGTEILLDLPQATTLAHGDQLLLEDGRRVEIRAVDEPVYRVRGRDGAHLARLAWHLGNRHAPAEIGADHLLIRRDPILRDMLAGLGAELEAAVTPFSPEPGAYQHGHDATPHALSIRR
jgi:urease accessory protein